MNPFKIGVAMLFLGASFIDAQTPQLLNYQGRVSVNGTNFTGTGQFKFALLNSGSNVARTASGTATVAYGFLVNVTITDGGAGYAAAPSATATGGGGSGAVLTAQLSGGAVTGVVVGNPGSGYTSAPAIQFSAPPSTYATLWSNDGSSANGNAPAAVVMLGVTNGLYSVLLGDTTVGNMAALATTVFTNSDVRLRVWFSDGVSGFQQLTPDQRIAAVGYALVAGTVPDGSITAAKIAPGSIGMAQLAPGVVVGTSNFQVAGNPNVQAAVNSAYVFTNAEANQVTLPANPSVGDRVRVTGGADGFMLLANPGQLITKPPLGWTDLSFPWFPPFGSSSASLASSADGSKLVAVQGGMSVGPIAISTNYGVMWSTNNNAGSRDWRSVAMSADGSKLAVGQSSSGRIWTSIDYGVTWFTNNNASPGEWRSVAMSADGSKLVAVQFSGIWISSDYGVTWSTNNNAGSRDWRSVAMSADGSKLVAGQFNGPIAISTNYGVMWSTNNNAGMGDWNSVAMSADGRKLVAGKGGFYSASVTSTNYGVTWSTNYNAGVAWSAVAMSVDGRKLVAGRGDNPSYYGPIATSINYGTTWSTNNNAGLGSWSAVAMNADGNNIVAVGTFQGNAIGIPKMMAIQKNIKWPKLVGQAFASIELIYTGGGLWSPVSYSGEFSIE